MKNGKSPSLDGLSCEIFKRLWKSTRRDMNGEFQNQGLLKPIPKDSVKDSIRGWQPINLLKVSYKILAKVLALGIKKS
jgi:hypothetical protein